MRFSACAFLLLAFAPASPAQSISILLQDGDVLPGIGTIDNGSSQTFFDLQVTDDGSWLTWFEVGNTDRDAVVLDGSLLWQYGDPVPGNDPPGATIDEIRFLHLTDAGDLVAILQIADAMGTVLGDAIYVDSTLVALVGGTPPGSWGAGTNWTRFDGAKLTADRSKMVVTGQVDDPTTAIVSDGFRSLWTLDAALNLVGEEVIARSGESLNGMPAGVTVDQPSTANFVFDTLGFNNHGHQFLFCSLAGAPSAFEDGGLWLNTTGTGGVGNQLVVLEGGVEPSTGLTVAGLLTPENDLNDAGDHVYVLELDSPSPLQRQHLFKNGEPFVVSFFIHPSFPNGHFVENFGNGPLKVAENGDVFWFAEVDGAGPTDDAWFRNLDPIAVEDSSMADGQTITQLRDLNGDMNISPSGRWMIFEGEISGVDTAFLMDLAELHEDFCNGVAGCIQCPCFNNAPPGTIGGCENLQGTSARLLASGVPSVTGDTLRFELAGATSSSFALLTSGAARAPANPANPCFGTDSGILSAAFDGLRCVVQDFQRHGTRPSDSNGDVGVTTNGWGPPSGPPAGLLAANGFVAGQIRHFQAIYRDTTNFSCDTGLNTTQGVTVRMVP